MPPARNLLRPKTAIRGAVALCLTALALAVVPTLAAAAPKAAYGSAACRPTHTSAQWNLIRPDTVTFRWMLPGHDPVLASVPVVRGSFPAIAILTPTFSGTLPESVDVTFTHRGRVLATDHELCY